MNNKTRQHNTPHIPSNPTAFKGGVSYPFNIFSSVINNNEEKTWLKTDKNPVTFRLELKKYCYQLYQLKLNLNDILEDEGNKFKAKTLKIISDSSYKNKSQVQLEMEKLQKLTFLLTFYYWNWHGAIRIPSLLKFSTTALDFYSKCFKSGEKADQFTFENPYFI